MTSFLPREFKVKVKERLRDARFVAREMRSQTTRVSGAAGPRGGDLPPTVSGLGRKIADFSDNALQTLETVAIGFLSSDPQAHFNEARAYPLDRYTGAASRSGQALFARESYFAAKQILRAKGSSNPRVSEQLFAAAYRLAAKEWSLSRAGADHSNIPSLEAVARDCAAMARALARTHPVLAPRHIDAEADGRPLNAVTYVASAVGLATAVATYHRDTLSPDDTVYAGVCAAVDARYAALEKAMSEQEQPEHLARAFAELIAHLP